MIWMCKIVVYYTHSFYTIMSWQGGLHNYWSTKILTHCVKFVYYLCDILFIQLSEMLLYVKKNEK